MGNALVHAAHTEEKKQRSFHLFNSEPNITVHVKLYLLSITVHCNLAQGFILIVTSGTNQHPSDNSYKTV